MKQWIKGGICLKGYVHSFESFGAVDGPGVRFVVFFQGCPLRCKYCHNPDTWEFHKGDLVECDEILQKLLSNKGFYKNGGITATGGEPLMQIDFLTELFRLAKSEGIHTCLDTSGITFGTENRDKIDNLLNNTDLVMLDIKHIDDKNHRELTGHSNKNILEFAKYIDEKGIPLRIRHVVVPEVTLNEKYLSELGSFLKGFSNIEKIETLPYHSMARHKYKELNMDYPMGDIPDASKDDAEFAKKIILDAMK